MKQLAKMLALVADQFKDKFDKGGQPYFLHCLYVMQNCNSKDENTLCIALGHDIIEDTPLRGEDLTEMGFNKYIVDGIDTLTRRDHQSYEDYIKRISMYPHLVPIKLADLDHNSKFTRLKGLTKADFDRMEKYQKAYVYLSKI